MYSPYSILLIIEVIRDKRTGDSLQYAFIEFDEREAAEMVSFTRLIRPMVMIRAVNDMRSPHVACMALPGQDVAIEESIR